MSLICRGREALAFEDMAEVAAAVGADNLGPRHAIGLVLVASDGSGEAVEVSGPAAAGLELVVGLVQRSIAAGARVDALAGVVLVKLPRSCGFSALLPEDAELLCSGVSRGRRAMVGMSKI